MDWGIGYLGTLEESSGYYWILPLGGSNSWNWLPEGIKFYRGLLKKGITWLFLFPLGKRVNIGWCRSNLGTFSL